MSWYGDSIRHREAALRALRKMNRRNAPAKRIIYRFIRYVPAVGMTSDGIYTARDLAAIYRNRVR